MLSSKVTKTTTIIFILTAITTTTKIAAQSCNDGEVRLVGGPSPNEGRVEVCLSGVWGTVTDDGFSTSDAIVVCRQLGYPVDDPGAATTSRCCAPYGPGSGSIHLDGVFCRGTESSLLECGYSSPSSSSDTHSEDVGVVCPCGPDGTIRLSNGLAPEEGIVEICFSGIWRSVCHSNWDHKDAFVVCRELGYPATAARVFFNAYFGEHPRPNISNILCYGNESKLLDCSYTNTTLCSPTNTAGVRCQGETIPDLPCFESTIRLTGGQDEHEGRVELCSNGVWGTICGGLWDYNDTTVVCKQLGFQNPRVFVYRSSSFFGQGNGPILYDDLTCDRTELALTQCSSSSPDQVYCSHISDVGAGCEEIATTVIDTCNDGDIRLMDGGTTAEGRVEICILNIWGSVCDDSWDVIDAGVVCNQLGFQSARATAYRSAYFGRSAGPYILDNVGCDGDEQTLLGCSHGGTFFHDCSPGKDAGVKCEVSSCLHGTVQLVGGVTSYGGRLELCNNGRWATVCYNNFGSVSASVICKQLLGENASAAWIPNYYGYFQDQGLSTSILDDLSCTGSESSISQCTYTEVSDFSATGCYHYYDVVMVCYERAGCTNLDVRLVDGDTGLEGRVEICVDGVWGAVRSHSITNLAASVICTQLGHPSEWSIPLSTTVFGRGEVPVLVYHTSCSEGAAALQDCNVLSYSTSPYSIVARYNSAVDGIICQGNVTSETECVPGDAKLAGGLKANEGRVEVCIDGFWGTVCEEEWDDEDAIVICKQLGLSSTANPALGFGEGRGPIISHVSCTSRESNITQCEWRTGTTNCHHGRDVAIRCEDLQEYPVTLVITSQQDEEGPFQIGTTVTLQCLVDPPLPVLEEITYTWTTSATRFWPQSTNSSFPNATVVISAGHPQEGRYYCHVFRGLFLLGVGAGSIQVRNLLIPIGNEFVDYTPTKSFTLNINETLTDIRYNFRALTWFHNGMEVIPNERIVLADLNKTLTIFNTTDDDSGVYEVKFTGLFVHPYSRNCEQDILALLRHYPIAIPVHFYVYKNTPELTIQDTTDTAVEFGFDENDQCVTSENISLTVSGKVHASVDETVSTRWYFNGDVLRPGTSVGPLQRPLLSIFQTIEIDNANYLDYGFYEIALTINMQTHLVSHLECPTEYYTFFENALGISDIVLARDVVQIMQPESSTEPTLSESSSSSSAVVGGVVGCTIAAILLVAIIAVACLWWKKKKSKSAEVTTSLEKNNEKTDSVGYASSTENVEIKANICYKEVRNPQYTEEIVYDHVN